MKLALDSSLAFTAVTLTYQGQVLTIPRVLVDCGSETSVFSVDLVSAIGILPEATDKVEMLRGVGGREVVFVRVIDKVTVGDVSIGPFTAEFGSLQYGFEINGILGMNFLLPSRAILNFGDLSLTFPA